MTVVALPRPRAGRNSSVAEGARRLVGGVGGRYSIELGVEVDRGDDEVERWFLAATLFGDRISAAIAGRTFLERAGVTRVGRARAVSWDHLVALLDEGGYARYDFRTATRLQVPAETLDSR